MEFTDEELEIILHALDVDARLADLAGGLLPGIDVPRQTVEELREARQRITSKISAMISPGYEYRFCR